MGVRGIKRATVAACAATAILLVPAASASGGEPPSVRVNELGTEAGGAIIGVEASFGGEVNPHGAEVTECHFDLEGAGVFESVPCKPMPGGGSIPVEVEGARDELKGETEYTLTLRAKSSAGSAVSESWSFTTPPEPVRPHPVPVVPPPAPPPQTPPAGEVAPFHAETPAPATPAPALAGVLGRDLAMSPAGSVSIKLSCAASATRCAGTLSLLTRHGDARIGAVGYSLRAGGRSVLRLRLGARWRRAVDRAGGLRARVSVGATAPAIPVRIRAAHR